MSARRAVVQNGRITLDVEYVDGTALTVIVAAEGTGLPDLAASERAELLASVDRGLGQLDAGMGKPAADVIRELRKRG